MSADSAVESLFHQTFTLAPAEYSFTQVDSVIDTLNPGKLKLKLIKLNINLFPFLT